MNPSTEPSTISPVLSDGLDGRLSLIKPFDWNAGAGSCLSSHKSLPVMYLNFLRPLMWV